MAALLNRFFRSRLLGGSSENADSLDASQVASSCPETPDLRAFSLDWKMLSEVTSSANEFPSWLV
jgi:hypothetical protein